LPTRQNAYQSNIMCFNTKSLQFIYGETQRNMQEKTFPSKDEANQNHQGKILSDAGLSFLLNTPEELLRFMDVSGYDPDNLRQALTTPELELAILSYFAGNEPALLAMCANSGIKPSRFMSFVQNQASGI